MSIGFSIGDFIQAIEVAKKIRKEFVGAPSQFKDISDEVRSLSIVLQDIEVVLLERELISQQKAELHDIIEGCRHVLHDLDKKLSKYGELKLDSESVGQRMKRAWKRLKWEPEDIRELRSRINSNITLLNAFNGRLTRDNVVKLIRHQDNQERRNILDWLAKVDYASQHIDFIGRRQEGTGQWLLGSNEFQAWLNASNQILFCPGIPGAGKTILAATVVDYLCTKFQNEASVGIAYIYCNFRSQEKQRSADLLASLLRQLVQGQPSVPDDVKNLYERHKDKPRPPPDDVSKVLHAVMSDYSRTFIIIDALDECQISDDSRNQFLSEIFNLRTKTGANIFATSRFIPEIMKTFEGCISLEIRASIDDVERYLDGHILRLPLCVSRSYALQENIKAEITKAVDGMFLLAQLHLESLIDKITPKAIRLALERLPKGSHALDHAYQEAMDRIEVQKTGLRDLAKQVLLWITCAKRPLTTLELRHALAVEIAQSELDIENLPEVEDMISVCAGLVTVDEESDVIRLVHYTAQEYFEQTWALRITDAQINITKTCFTYLAFKAFNSGFCPTDETFTARLQENPFLDYAAKHWGSHARGLPAESIEESALHFLGCESNVSCSTQAMIVPENEYPGYSQQGPKQATGVHLAAHFGLRDMVGLLLMHNHHPDAKDSNARTPLSWTAWRGHDEVVNLLIGRNDVDRNSKDYRGRTPLSWAARGGHIAVVTLLVKHDDVEADIRDDDYGQTPLSLAARGCYEAVAKMVERVDVQADYKDQAGRTQPLCTPWTEHGAVIKLLVEHDDVETDFQDHDHTRAPLSWAANKGHEAVVRLLVKRDDVRADSRDKNGRTPLSWAARGGYEGIVKLLLEQETVNADSEDKNGRTPLSLAAWRGKEEVVKVLIERNDVGIMHKDCVGRTPLSWAASRGHQEVVSLLLKKGGDIDMKDVNGRTPLSLAAEKGHEAVVKLLLANDDVDPNSKDIYGRTPLSWAAGSGHEAVVRLLLAKGGVDLNTKDTEYGRMPLSWATQYGHEAVVRLLLVNGV